jgi:hypothetical protein
MHNEPNTAPMGANMTAFGHTGTGSAFAWCDRDRNLAFAYCTNFQRAEAGIGPRGAAVSVAAGNGKASSAAFDRPPSLIGVPYGGGRRRRRSASLRGLRGVREQPAVLEAWTAARGVPRRVPRLSMRHSLRSPISPRTGEILSGLPVVHFRSSRPQATWAFAALVSALSSIAATLIFIERDR